MQISEEATLCDLDVNNASHLLVLPGQVHLSPPCSQFPRAWKARVVFLKAEL